MNTSLINDDLINGDPPTSMNTVDETLTYGDKFYIFMTRVNVHWFRTKIIVKRHRMKIILLIGMILMYLYWYMR
jgi:hypothetical protein